MDVSCKAKMGSTTVICPVCSKPCKKLPQHLEYHSKEEIIHSLSLNKSQYNLPNRQLAGGSESSHQDGKRIANNYCFNDEANIPSGSSIVRSSSISPTSSAPFTPASPSKTSLISIMKNNNNNNDSAAIPSNIQSLGSSFIQNDSCVSQFAPQTYSILYRQPNSLFQSFDGSNQVNAPILMQNGNQNNSLSSQNMRSPVYNQPLTQTELAISQASGQVGNEGSNFETRSSQAKVNSNVSSVPLDSFTGNMYFPNNGIPNNNQSQVLCLLPYSQVYPSFPVGGNFMMYNNNMVPSNGSLPNSLQHNGVTYILGGNNQNMPVNNSPVPNQMYFLPSNVPTVGVRQEGPQFSIPSQNLSFNKNISQENSIPLSYSTSESITETPLTSTVSDNFLNTISSTVASSSSSANKSMENENVITIKIGNNIKISLPKDVAGKKDRLKELINRELVRAILINDSEESESKCNDPQNNNKEEGSAQKKEENIPLNCLNDTNIKATTNSDTVLGSSNPIIDSVSLENSSIHNDSHLPENQINTSEFKVIPESVPKESRLIRNFFTSVDSSFDCTIPKIGLFTETFTNEKLPVKIKDEICTAGSSNSSQNNPSISKNSSLSFLSPGKNLNFLDVFSEVSYGGEDELGAVEEVLASENSVQTNSIDFKPEPVSSKLFHSLSSENSNDNYENQSSGNSIDNEIQMSLYSDTFPSPKMPSKYAKTYFRVRNASDSTESKRNTVNFNSIMTSVIDKPQIIMDTSQINTKIQNLSEQIDEEMVDDPLYQEVENSNMINEDFVSNLPSTQEVGDECVPEESKEYVSLYQGIPMKLENGESNGTLAEEVLSLKASETLADSDSERATPNEEVAEMYYGKSCIFAGEPGPSNLSSQRYTPIEALSQNQAVKQAAENEHLEETPGTSSQVTVDLSVNAVRTHGEIQEEMISLTLDANCSIVPADTVQQLPDLLYQDESSIQVFKGNFFKKENSSEELSRQNLANFNEDWKAFVTTGIVDDCLIPVSPLASTSGLQNLYKDSVKKVFVEDEDYDFEYESDGYGDSDFSDTMHHKNESLDLEKWRCNRCNKTFKSLKEKLLHSGHHSPCSLDGKTSLLEETKLNVENMSRCEDGIRPSKSVVLKEESLDSKLNSSEKINKKSNLIKGKKKVLKIKPEVKADVSLDSTAVTSTPVIGPEEFTCTDCSLSFPTLDKLYEHKKTALKSRYMCPVCHKEFQSRIEKLRHLKTHPASDLMCSICHRSFDNFYLWSKHQLFHMGLIFYECKECGYKCQRKGELKIHYRKHSGEKPFSCETCLRSFVSSLSLKRHLLVHMEGQEAECDICFKRYKNGLVLTKHKLKIHSKKKMFVKKRTDFICETCNEIFHSEKKLIWHQETHKRWPKKCQSCGDCFIHQANLTKHIRRKHDANYMPPGSDKDNSFCPICKKVYKRSSLPLHMRIHNGVKPYKCNVCGKEFTVKCNFNSHKWTHTGMRDRPFKCKLCDRSFHLQGLLDIHIRSHKKIRPYTCNECGKSFIRKNNYQTHKKLHTDEKQHKCQFCGKTFFRKYNLNNHVRIHTGETPYECTICRKEFAQKSNYNVHMKAFHVERHAIHEEV